MRKDTCGQGANSLCCARLSGCSLQDTSGHLTCEEPLGEFAAVCLLPAPCRVEAEGPLLSGTAAEGAVRQAVLAAEAQLAAMMEPQAFAAVQGKDVCAARLKLRRHPLSHTLRVGSQQAPPQC